MFQIFFQATEPSPVTKSKSVYAFLCGEDSCASDLSEPQLQILGVLKCLIEAIMPDNMPTQNRMIIPMYLQAIATTISLLPVSLIRHRVFLNILWWVTHQFSLNNTNNVYLNKFFFVLKATGVSYAYVVFE